jgi:hypothetical protein
MNYYDHPALNASTLKNYIHSPRSGKLAELSSKSSSSMVFGSAVHAFALEPHMAHDMFAVEPEVNKRTKAGRAEIAEFNAACEADGVSPISEKDWYKAQDIAALIREHPVVSDLGLLEHDKEKDYFWSWNGQECKAKMDIVTPLCVADIKTTSKGSGPSQFGYACKDYHYALQAAWYLDGARACGHDVDTFYFIAASTTGSYDVAVYKCTDAFLDFGREQIGIAFDNYLIAQGRSLDDLPSAYPDLMEL